MEEKVLDWFLSLPAEKREQMANAIVSERVPVSKVKNINSLPMKDKEKTLVNMGFLKEQVRGGGKRPIYAVDKTPSSPMKRMYGRTKLDIDPFSEEGKQIVDYAKDFACDKKGNKLRPTSKYVQANDSYGNSKLALNPNFKE